MSVAPERTQPGHRSLYVGRFAPTPSGPLHLGSLVAALASFLDARHSAGIWLLRLDDLDRERCRDVHADSIVRQLDDHGLHWDGPIHRQSEHVVAYEAALDKLLASGSCYRCDCNRSRLARESLDGPWGAVYSGRCRDRVAPASCRKLRLRVGNASVSIEDAWRGRLQGSLATDIGDFVVRRADGTTGYQLASVIDESLLGITDVVRGADLIGSSLAQRHLHGLLGQRPPAFRHVPLVLGADGRKLSKQNHAEPLRSEAAAEQLSQALNALQHKPPKELSGAGISELLGWAIKHWQPRRLGCSADIQCVS